MSDGTGTTAWGYDGRGNMLSETRVIGAKTYGVAYGYDLAGHVIKQTYPSGRMVNYTRDNVGRVLGVTTQVNVASPAMILIWNILYQPYGERSGGQMGNGTCYWKSFTADDQTAQYFITTCATNSPLIALAYGRIDGMNLTNIWDNLTPANSQSLWYTPSRRLQNASGPWGATSYSYDGVGNRTYDVNTLGTTTTTKNTYYASTSNAMGGVLTNGTQTRSYGYDAAGELIKDVNGAATTLYAWNNDGQIAPASVQGLVTGAYLYDGLERLGIRTVTNTPSNGVTHLIYDQAGHVLTEVLRVLRGRHTN